jgi:hypothetical protein
VSAGIVGHQAAHVEQAFPSTGPPDPLAAARRERNVRAAERKRINEIRGRYKQAFDELAVLEAEHGRGHRDVKKARKRAWNVAHELMDAQRAVDRRVDRARATTARRRA